MKNYFVRTKFVSIFLAVLMLTTTRCVSTTLIQSTPTGAKIYIDGQPAGMTPYTYSDTKVVGSVTSVKIEKEGYEPMNTMFTRSEQADVGAIIGGVFILVPFLWTMKYNPTHTYELTPLTDSNKIEMENQVQQITESKADKLRELKKLLDEKILTQEEYEKEKQKILEEDK